MTASSLRIIICCLLAGTALILSGCSKPMAMRVSSVLNSAVADSPGYRLASKADNAPAVSPLMDNAYQLAAGSLDRRGWHYDQSSGQYMLTLTLAQRPSTTSVTSVKDDGRHASVPVDQVDNEAIDGAAMEAENAPYCVINCCSKGVTYHLGVNITRAASGDTLYSAAVTEEDCRNMGYVLDKMIEAALRGLDEEAAPGQPVIRYLPKEK